MEEIKTNTVDKTEDKAAKAKFTGEADILTRATVGDARIYVARTTRLVRKLSLRHKASHLATAALGRTVTGALLLAATMKNEEGVGIKVSGDGPIQGITGEAQGGIARGYVGNPDVYLPPKNGHLDVGGAVGNGTISVTRYTAGAKPFTGTAELVDGEIADDLTRYLYTSEQTPSSVGLGVLVDETGDVQAAGGWFIQALAGQKCAAYSLCFQSHRHGLYPGADHSDAGKRYGSGNSGQLSAAFRLPLQPGAGRRRPADPAEKRAEPAGGG